MTKLIVSKMAAGGSRRDQGLIGLTNMEATNGGLLSGKQITGSIGAEYREEKREEKADTKKEKVEGRKNRIKSYMIKNY